jgi:hypothetical protein
LGTHRNDDQMLVGFAYLRHCTASKTLSECVKTPNVLAGARPLLS